MTDGIITISPEENENEILVVSEYSTLTNKQAKSKLKEKYNKEINKLHRTFRKDAYQNYKDPEENHSQIIDISQLQDPPDDFKILNLDARHPEMADGFALVVHHFWNINPQTFPRNAQDRIRLFRKLVYNQDEQYRPRDLRELSDLSRDAGPRLLKPEILRRLGKLPISRHYPEFSEDTDWEEQRNRPINLPENEASEKNDGYADGDGSGALALEETPPNLDLIRECLERLLIQLRYRQLEVVGPKLGEESFHALIDTSESSRRKRLPSHKVMLTLDNNHNVEKACGGFTQQEYPCREKGPVGDEFEPASHSKYDSIMMAGKFLDSGITKVDVENLHSHGGQETNAHRNFLNMVQADWKKSGDTRSDDARRYFHRLLNDLQAKDFRELLYKSTLLRPQFNHTISRTIRCDNDHEVTPSLNSATVSLICFDGPYIEDTGSGVTMQQVLQSLFPQQESPQVVEDQMQDYKCTVKACAGKSKKIIIRRSMPLRIAVSLSSQISPTDHTSNDIRIRFHDEAKGGAEDVAVYRWIGGIYADTQVEDCMTHYRVYWTDSLRGGKPCETISIYDPFQADGQVIEGVFPASQNEPIPAGWWQDKFKPVLFFERVFNPDLLDITLAAAILGDMKHASDNSQYILQVHDPQWNISAPPDDQFGNQGDSHPSRPSPSPRFDDRSRPSEHLDMNMTGYAGAAFETELNDLESGDVHMQDGIGYNDLSQPPTIFSQSVSSPAVRIAGHNSIQGGRSRPPTTQSTSDDHGMFCAFNSDMTQVAPDRPRSLLTEHYSHPATTNTSASNFARRDLGQRTQRIAVQPSNMHGSSFASQNTQMNSQFAAITSVSPCTDPSPHINPLNQAGASHISNGFPSPTVNYNEYLQMTPLMSHSNSPLQKTVDGYGKIPTGDTPDSLFAFDGMIDPNTQDIRGDVLASVPSYPDKAPQR